MDLRARRTIIFLLFCVFSGSLSISANEISGWIKMEPPYPAAKVVKVRKKVQDSCAEEQISKSLLVSSEGNVANAVLWLDGEFSTQGKSLSGQQASATGEETQSLLKRSVTLDQNRCNFEPHVILIPPGGRLQILNSDPLAHDVRAFEKAVMLFRLDMDALSKPEERFFDKSGIYTIRCGLHPWMHAFVVQAANELYAVTDTDGTFTLKNVPNGKHTLHIWHEILGEVEIPLEVNVSTKDFSYTFKNVSSSSL